jgi:hypothetical protein
LRQCVGFGISITSTARPFTFTVNTPFVSAVPGAADHVTISPYAAAAIQNAATPNAENLAIPLILPFLSLLRTALAAHRLFLI